VILKPDRKLWTPSRSVVMPRSWWRQRGFFTPMGFMKTPFKVDAADFDGTNDYMRRVGGLTGASDSKTGIIVAWCRVDGGDGTTREILSGSFTLGSGADLPFRLLLSGLNRIGLFCKNPAGTIILDIFTTSGSVLAGSSWRNFLASWDMADTAKRHIYLDDSSDLNITTYTNDVLDYTCADWAVGANPGANFKFNGPLAEIYFAPGQYLDFSVEANRRKFISSSGKPVNLGSDGSKPAGIAPIVYQHLDDGEAVANFATNRGTGGDFSITGTLTTADSSPSD
jgi:hypothetical protein